MKLLDGRKTKKFSQKKKKKGKNREKSTQLKLIFFNFLKIEYVENLPSNTKVIELVS